VNRYKKTGYSARSLTEIMDGEIASPNEMHRLS
jgi:hypothetical protein